MTINSRMHYHKWERVGTGGGGKFFLTPRSSRVHSTCLTPNSQQEQTRKRQPRVRENSCKKNTAKNTAKNRAGNNTFQVTASPSLTPPAFRQGRAILQTRETNYKKYTRSPSSVRKGPASPTNSSKTPHGTSPFCLCRASESVLEAFFFFNRRNNNGSRKPCLSACSRALPYTRVDTVQARNTSEKKASTIFE